MAKKFKLTQVEWEIMESVWSLGNRTTARDVHNRTFPRGEKAYTTVQTIMNKLHEKGMLKKVKIGNVNFFSPTRSRGVMIKNELSFFISELFNGSVSEMANFLIDSNNLSLGEIQKIKNFIEQKEKELEGDS
jgi:BlaI family penicillinase repressor